MSKFERSLETEVADTIRSSLVDIPVDGQWRIVTETLRMPHRQRSISKAYVSLCVVHNEKTPSLFMYPSGTCMCYGCQFGGDAPDLIVAQRHLPVDEFIQAAGLSISSSLPSELGEIQRQIKAEREALWHDLEIDEEPF